MSTRMKKLLKRSMLIIIGLHIMVMLGMYLSIRANTPAGISYDPADEGYCEAYGIELDTTQVEAIYLYPETILTDPDAFLSSDSASIRLANLRDIQ